MLNIRRLLSKDTCSLIDYVSWSEGQWFLVARCWPWRAGKLRNVLTIYFFELFFFISLIFFFFFFCCLCNWRVIQSLKPVILSKFIMLFVTPLNYHFWCLFIFRVHIALRFQRQHSQRAIVVCRATATNFAQSHSNSNRSSLGEQCSSLSVDRRFVAKTLFFLYTCNCSARFYNEDFRISSIGSVDSVISFVRIVLDVDEK